MMASSSLPSISAARMAAWRRLAGLDKGRSVPFEGAGDESAPRRDRAQANRLVNGVLRNLSLIDAWLERPKLHDPAKTPGPLLWILRIAVFEKIFQSSIPDYAIGEQAVELARKAGGERAGRFVNAVLRRLLKTLPDSIDAMKADPFWGELPAEVRWSIPGAIARALAEGYGGVELESLWRALTEEEAPVWLRVNTLKTTPEKAVRNFKSGVDTVDDVDDVDKRKTPSVGPSNFVLCPSPAAPPEALLWTSGAPLPWTSEAWGRGELTVQDVGAMLAGHVLAPEAGMRVADVCAAPGGKTGHLWELMGGVGRLVAIEVDVARRGEMKAALVRLYGAGHGIEIPEMEKAIGSLEGESFDRVLVDAPCQGLGLLRRHPEIRWDDRLKRRGEVQRTQRGVLEDAARLVRPGGRLLWVTCSPTRAENEEIIAGWIKENQGWWVADPRPLLRPEWMGWIQMDRNVIRTRPDRMPCDGFAMTLLERLK